LEEREFFFLINDEKKERVTMLKERVPQNIMSYL